MCGKYTWIFTVLLYTCCEQAALLSVFILLKDQNYDVKKQEILSFKFSASTFDLVFLGVLRFSILIGASFGIICNNVDSALRLRRGEKYIMLYGSMQTMYVLVKVVYYTKQNQIRLWPMSGITLASSVMLYYCWGALALDIPANFQKLQSPENLNSFLNSGTSPELFIDNDELSTTKIIKELIKLARTDMHLIVPAFISLATCSICQSAVPFYTGLVVNHLVIDRSLEKSNKALMTLALITFLRGFSAGLRAGLFRYVLGRYKLRLQRSLFSNLMEMEIAFFDAHKTGELTSRLTTDCSKIGDGLGLRLNIFVRSIVKVLGVLFFMVKLSWKLSVVTLVALPVVGLLSRHFGTKFRLLSDKVQKTLADANASAEEVLSSMRTVRSFANETGEVDRYSQHLDRTQVSMRWQSILSACYSWSSELTNFVMSILILYYGGHLFLNYELLGGHLVSFILYSFELTYAAQDIGNVYTGLIVVIGASRNIFLYAMRKPRILMNFDAKSKQFIKGDIEFRNVFFSYPLREDVYVLNNISFTARRGEVVALVGSSGSGKSSIMSLLEHFYEPDQGQVLIDSVPVQDYNHHVLHERMSLVQQEPILFACSIAENISYGINNASHQDVCAAAELANAHSFISTLPNGYFTETGEKGIQISGGQKQRVAIARALIRKPTILLLDEATSALDAESEHLVQQAINNNLSGRTVLIIAHRLSTVEKADKILVLHKGRIVEEGKHNDLLLKNGLYSELVKKQVLEVSVIPHEISRRRYYSHARRRGSVARDSCSSLVSVISNAST